MSTPLPSAARSGRPLLVSNAIDAAGRQGSDLAIDLLAVTTLGASALEMGVLNALGTAAFLFLGIPIGVLVDRSQTAALIARSGLIRAALLATILLAWYLDALTIWYLYAVAAFAGVATVVTETAQTAITPRINGPDGVARLVASMQSAEAVVGFTIPAGAGLAVAWLGAPPVLALAAALIVCAALVVTRQSLNPAPAPAPTASKGRFLQEAGQGWRVLRGDPTLWRLTLASVLVNFGLALYSAFEAVLIVRTLDLGSTGLGLAASAGAAGALTGASVAVPAAGRFGSARVMAGAVIALPIAALLPLVALLDPARALVWILAGSLLWGVAIVCYNIHAAGITAGLTPPEAMGRVSATRRTLTMGIVPAGSLLGGALADYAGMALALIVWACLCLFATLLALTAFKQGQGPRAPHHARPHE